MDIRLKVRPLHPASPLKEGKRNCGGHYGRDEGGARGDRDGHPQPAIIFRGRKAAEGPFALSDFISIYRCDWLSGKNKIQHKPITHKQVDRENHWDDYIILQALVMTAVHKVLPGFRAFPANNWKGLLQVETASLLPPSLSAFSPCRPSPLPAESPSDVHQQSVAADSASSHGPYGVCLLLVPSRPAPPHPLLQVSIVFAPSGLLPLATERFQARHARKESWEGRRKRV